MGSSGYLRGAGRARWQLRGDGVVVSEVVILFRLAFSGRFGIRGVSQQMSELQRMKIHLELSSLASNFFT